MVGVIFAEATDGRSTRVTRSTSEWLPVATHAYNANFMICIRLTLGSMLTALLVLAGCSPEPLGVLENPESEFSAVRYKDRNLVSLNTRCPVTDDPLSTVIEPVYANGRPIGFC